MTTLPAGWSDKVKPQTCLVWTGAINSRGYGSVWIGDRTALAHRVAYEAEKGPIPDGLTIDHLCGNKRCVRVEHLEPVTAAENLDRERRSWTHCIHGHPFDIVHPNGRRGCSVCLEHMSTAAYRWRHSRVTVTSQTAIRLWARDVGIPVAPTGRLFESVLMAYAQAHQPELVSP